MAGTFRALVARQVDGAQKITMEMLQDADLPAGDVTVRVEYSSFNYKDGLALQGKSRILRNHPVIPGIDFAGTVLRSESSAFQPGDSVVLTGWGVGESWSGGFAERAKVKSEWLVKLPATLTARQSMMIGTAGLTAMLSVMTLEEHGLKPNQNPVAVTGATGGVGSVATMLLSTLGYSVAASTGKKDAHDYLKSLGATSILDRAELAKTPARPLESQRWSGAIDTVGGTTLSNLLTSMALHGSIAVCGLAGSSQFETTVFPFILRGVNLLGIDSNWVSKERRQKAWQRLATTLPLKKLDTLTEEISLDQNKFFMSLKQFPSQARAPVSFDIEDKNQLCQTKVKAAGRDKEGRIEPIKGVSCGL